MVRSEGGFLRQMEEPRQLKRALMDATTGAISWGILRTVTSPLDVIKIRFQPLEGVREGKFPNTLSHQEVTATVLYIGRIPHGFYEEQMEGFFKQFGKIKRLRIARNKKNSSSKLKLARSKITICHYAGDVTYQTQLFFDKNKGYVVAQHQALLNASHCPFIAGLFPPLSEESSKSSKFSLIGSRFKLRCEGVMEAIRISCAGYPTRQTFDEFIDRFGILAPKILDGSSDRVTAAKRLLLEKVDLKGYQIGKTKVFLRAGQMAQLDARRSEVLRRSANIIQTKGYLHHLATPHIIHRDIEASIVLLNSDF